jgi:uncharacterized membrane protein YeaQ/YmgE (transglycosylase-associated protein family)
MIIIAILVFGMCTGWVAGWILGANDQITWGTRLIAGLTGSFVGGMLGSLLFEDDFAIHPSGLLGSLIGAIIVLVIWQFAVRNR